MLGLLKKGFFRRSQWRVKLPIIVGLAFTLISLPFILGILEPSIHEGNLYSYFYVLANMPVIMLFGPIAQLFEKSIFNKLDTYYSNLLFIILALIFWVLVSFIIAVFVDKSKKRKISSV